MARTRSAGYDEQREQILAAAARTFALNGYPGATMIEVARACGVSKALLYHYVRDKQDLLAQISAGHVARLEALVAEVHAMALAPDAHLRTLIERFTAAYASAQHEHRVLTEDVKFLGAAERQAVQAGQRRVVAAFAQAIAALRPELAARQITTPLAMLLLGMINWTFTWLRPQGRLTHAGLAPIVADLFFGGLTAVAPPAHRAPPSAAEPGSLRPPGRARARTTASV